MKLSIIVPVYNVEKYLPQCLDSILGQTLRNIEIICVDDGSTDNSPDILQRYAAKDQRMKIISVAHQGAALCRNLGLKQAQGDYLSVLDSDDFFDKRLLEEAYNQCRQDQADICVYDVWYYDNASGQLDPVPWAFQRDKLPAKRPFSFHDNPDYIFNFTNNWAWNKMFRRRFVEDNGLHFQNVAHTNDTYFTCMAMVLAKAITVLDRKYVYYRTNAAASLTSHNIRQSYPQEIFKVLSAIQKSLHRLGAWQEVKRSFILSLIHI